MECSYCGMFIHYSWGSELIHPMHPGYYVLTITNKMVDSKSASYAQS
jgi:hypothetical protein